MVPLAAMDERRKEFGKTFRVPNHKVQRYLAVQPALAAGIGCGSIDESQGHPAQHHSRNLASSLRPIHSSSDDRPCKAEGVRHNHQGSSLGTYRHYHRLHRQVY